MDEFTEQVIWVENNWPGLIEFISKKETNYINDEEIYMWVEPYNLEEFAELLNIDFESNLEVTLQSEGTICVNLVDIIEWTLEIDVVHAIKMFDIGGYNR